MVSVVAVAALLGGVGACAPSAKPVGYIGGTALLAVGTALMATPMASSGGDASDPVTGAVDAVGDIGGAIAQVTFGFALAVTGAVVLIAALASPGESAASTVPAGPPPPALGPWRQPPPSRSPSAPSGSPLAASSSGALSMRGGSTLAFH